MKKWFIFIIIIAVLGFGGFYGYHKAKAAIAEKAVEQFENNLTDTDIQNLKEDPDIKKFLESSDVDLSALNLPIKTKDDAINLISKKLSIGDIKDMISMAAGGFTQEEKSEIKTKIEQKFTPEELEAFKAIAAKELNR